MTDRINTLVKRISETRPVQGVRRQALLSELRALRNDLDMASAPDQGHSLDAALLLLEFMNRSDDVATADTLQIVASLVAAVDEQKLRHATMPSPPAVSPSGAFAGNPSVHEHEDLRITQESLLGSVLVHAGVISADSLARALQLHASSGQALGQCLVQLGAASPAQIASAVAYQDRLRDEERTASTDSEPQGASGIGLRLSPKQKGYVQSMHSQVLGEVLIRLGVITREKLDKALKVKRAASLHVGEALVETGAATWEQVKRGLEVQKQLRKCA